MSKWLLAAVVGTCALLVAAIAVVRWATDDTPTPPDALGLANPPAGAAAEKPARVSTAPAASPTPAATIATATTAVPARRPGSAAPPSRAAAGSLDTDLVRVRRNFRDELQHGLAALQDLVASCSAGPASFTLDLESVPGGIRVLDAAVEDRGDATDRGVSCAQSKLREHFIDAPSVEPGKRWKISFAIRAPTP